MTARIKDYLNERNEVVRVVIEPTRRAWQWRMRRLVDCQTDADLAFASDDLDQQDAALLESAPALLAALETIAAIPKHSFHDDGENVAQMVAVAKRAISKAEGRA